VLSAAQTVSSQTSPTPLPLPPPSTMPKTVSAEPSTPEVLVAPLSPLLMAAGHRLAWDAVPSAMARDGEETRVGAWLGTPSGGFGGV
jgi:hypothetical protein